MYIITFYSFKGGVGRTMALVNVAAELVRRGRKVLVVDFDLEAPGLETYKQLRPKEPHPGIVEYVTKFRQTREVPDFHDYIYETKPMGKRGGRLWVMPAGRRDPAYRNALTDLDWKRLYQDEGGFLLFEDTKKGWEKELKPDYVLIDSRTGDTDVLGICTRQLPDAVVLMFMPNEQNLAGLKNIVRDIRREETEGLKKKIHLHFVAANVPRLDDEENILRERLIHFRNGLEFGPLDGIIDRYDSLRLLDQPVFVMEHPRSRLAKQYRRLVRKLMMHNLQDWNELFQVFSTRSPRPVHVNDRLFEYNIVEYRFRPYKDWGFDITRTGRVDDPIYCFVNSQHLFEKHCYEQAGHFPSEEQMEDWLAEVDLAREPKALFHLALLSWGISGNMSKSLCRRILELDPCKTFCSAADFQALALIYWRLGDHTRAKESVQRAIRLMEKKEVLEPSYWRCRDASSEEFREDCRQIERLIDGEPLQPLFLAGRAQSQSE